MKIYRTQKEVEEDIKDGVLAIKGDVKFECDINIKADITAKDIDARDINAWDITARDIDARNITAENITAKDIIANNISYWAFCLSYNSIKCSSWKSRRNNYKEPICLDGELIIKEDEVEVIVDGNKTMISREVAKTLNLIK